MEKQPQKESSDLKNYGRFLNFEEFDAEPIIVSCKKSHEYKKITTLALKDRLQCQENPERLNNEYKKILEKTNGVFYELIRMNEVSEGMVMDFLNENNISEPVLIQGLNLSQARSFIENSLTFFDKRLSSTVLALAEDNFEYLKESLTEIRGKLSKTKEDLSSEEFELLPRDENKIKMLKERLALIENL